MLTIYHNNRCGKSRTALSVLEEKGVKYNVIDYLKDVPTVEELKSILKKLRLKPQDIIRTKEAVYLENYKGKNLTDEQCLDVMHKHPILIERPIVINGNKAVLARPPERIYEIL